jgi:hypothetical protein
MAAENRNSQGNVSHEFGADERSVVDSAGLFMRVTTTIIHTKWRQTIEASGVQQTVAKHKKFSFLGCVRLCPFI